MYIQSQLLLEQAGHIDRYHAYRYRFGLLGILLSSAFSGCVIITKLSCEPAVLRSEFDMPGSGGESSANWDVEDVLREWVYMPGGGGDSSEFWDVFREWE